MKVSREANGEIMDPNIILLGSWLGILRIVAIGKSFLAKYFVVDSYFLEMSLFIESFFKF